MDPYTGIVGSLVKSAFTKILDRKLNHLPLQAKNALINKILYNKELVSKIYEIETRFTKQGDIAALMAVQEIVDLIPIPEVPAIINAGIDIGYQGIKTIGTAEEVKNGIDIVNQLLSNSNQVESLGKHGITRHDINSLSSHLNSYSDNLNKISKAHGAMGSAVTGVQNTLNRLANVKNTKTSIGGYKMNNYMLKNYKKSRKVKKNTKVKKSRKVKKTRKVFKK
tara:strand:- start:5451 stop:6119 length:669 start_codon:yes stop_codon:yes gene_type:complete